MAGEAIQLEQSLRGYFLHPHHSLEKTHKDTDFTCDACRTAGRGTRYRCDPCDFDLHVYCAFCPQTVLSPLLPPRIKLTLVRKLCGVCSKFIESFRFYRCHVCEMDFHPRCLGITAAGTSKAPPRRFSQLSSREWQQHLAEETRPVNLASPLHPHKLRLRGPYCNECGDWLTGIFYLNVDHNSDLHPLCHQKTMPTASVNHPPPAAGSRLYFFMHPEHELMFVQRSQIPPDSAEELRSRWCAVCGGIAEGNCYMCTPCGFRLHRECASLRPAVRDEAHPAHALHYLKSKPAPCVACKESCIMWRYHCNICYVHIHKDCLKGPAAPSPDEHDVPSLLGLSI